MRAGILLTYLLRWYLPDMELLVVMKESLPTYLLTYLPLGRLHERCGMVHILIPIEQVVAFFATYTHKIISLFSSSGYFLLKPFTRCFFLSFGAFVFVLLFYYLFTSSLSFHSTVNSFVPSIYLFVCPQFPICCVTLLHSLCTHCGVSSFFFIIRH